MSDNKDILIKLMGIWIRIMVVVNMEEGNKSDRKAETDVKEQQERKIH